MSLGQSGCFEVLSASRAFLNRRSTGGFSAGPGPSANGFKMPLTAAHRAWVVNTRVRSKVRHLCVMSKEAQ